MRAEGTRIERCFFAKKFFVPTLAENKIRIGANFIRKTRKYYKIYNCQSVNVLCDVRIIYQKILFFSLILFAK